MTTAPRCEPPEGRRDREGAHWICRDEQGAEPFIDDWYPADERHQGFFDIAGGPPSYGKGYRYIMPVSTPAEIAALVRAGRKIGDMTFEGQPFDDCNCDECAALRALSAALAPFGDIPDAE